MRLRRSGRRVRLRGLLCGLLRRLRLLSRTRLLCWFRRGGCSLGLSGRLSPRLLRLMIKILPLLLFGQMARKLLNFMIKLMTKILPLLLACLRSLIAILVVL